MDGSALTNTLTTSAPCLCRARIVLRNRVVPRLRVGVSVTCETRRSTERTSCRTGPLRPARRAPSLAETHSATAERATTAQSPCSPSWTRTLSERVQTNKSRVGFGERRRADETAPPVQRQGLCLFRSHLAPSPPSTQTHYHVDLENTLRLLAQLALRDRLCVDARATKMTALTSHPSSRVLLARGSVCVRRREHRTSLPTSISYPP